MGAFETISAKLELTADSFTSTIGDANSSLDTLESKSKSTSKAVGMMGAALGAAAAGGLAKSISAASGLNASLTESAAIMGDLTEDEMQGMEQAARDVAKSTTFSAAEAGDAFYYLASAGMDAEQSMAAVGDVAQFAQAGAFDLATATDLATDAQSALGLASEDAAENQENLNRVMDTLVKSNQLANASVEEFSSALTNKAAAAMREAGIEIEEGASALATFADQGLKGNRAGTILARTIQGLQSSAQKNSKAFEKLGVSVYDSEGNMRAMADITEDMEGALAGMSTEQRNAAMNQLGLNERAAQGLSLMMGNSEAMREYEGELQDAGGAAEEVANNQLQSFQNQLALLKSNIMDVAIGIGNVFLPHLTKLVSGLTSVVQRFADFSSKLGGLPGAIALVSTMLGGFYVAASQLGGVVGSSLVPSMGSLATGMLAVLGPIAAVAAAISAAAYVWKTDFAGMRTHVGYFVEKVQGPLSQAMQSIESLVTSVADTFASAWERSTSRVEAKLGGAVSLGMYLLGEKLVGAIDTVNAKINEWQMVWDRNAGLIEDTIAGFLTTVGGLAETIFLHLGPVVSFIRDVFRETFESAFESIASIGRTVFDLVLDLGKRFGIFGEDVNTAAEVLGQLLDPFRKVELAVSGVGDAIGILADVWDDDWLGIQSTAEDATARIGELFGGMESDSATTFETIQTTAEEAFGRLEERTQSATSDMTASWEAHGGGVRDAMGGLVESLSELFGVITEEIIPQFTEMLSGLLGEHFAELAELWEVHGEGVMNTVLVLTEGVIRLFEELVDAVLVVWNLFGDEILSVLEFTLDILMVTVRAFADVLLTAFTVLGQALEGDWEGVWNSIAGLLERTLERMYDFFGEWGGRLLEWLGGLVGDVIQWFKDLYQDLVGGSVVPDMLSDLLSAFETFGSDVLEWLGNMTGEFLSDIISWGEDVASEIEGAFEDAKGFAEDVVENMKESVVGIIEGIGDAAADAFKSAFNEAIPSSVGIDPVTVAGKEIYGGGSVSLPSLDTGGYIRKDGLAMLHAGETVVPADTGRSPSGPPAQFDIDFGNLDDDDYVSVGALKQLIKAELQDEDRRKRKSRKASPKGI